MREDYISFITEKESNMSFATEELAKFFEDDNEIPTNEEPLSND